MSCDMLVIRSDEMLGWHYHYECKNSYIHSKMRRFKSLMHVIIVILKSSPVDQEKISILITN